MKKINVGSMQMPWAIPNKELIKINADTPGIRKYIGLMFQIKPSPLSFEFDKPVNIPIHSFFCRKFYAYWFDNNNQLIEKRLVKPFRINIKPNREFVKLVEVPMSLVKDSEKKTFIF